MPRLDINGISINVECFPGDDPTLLLLHGFTGSIDAWQGVPQRLADRFSVVAIDLIGHGQTSSPRDPERYSIEHAVNDLACTLEHLDLESATVLGYSMGGRVALHFALTFPERVRALMLESASPGIRDPDLRRERLASDERLAGVIECEGIESFVDYWELLPLFVSQHSLPEETRERQRALRLTQNPVGLANSLRGMGAGKMEPVWNRLRDLKIPVLFLAGALDTKYCHIGRELAEAVPGARYVEVPGAGHTIHLERPDAYLDVVSSHSSEESCICHGS